MNCKKRLFFLLFMLILVCLGGCLGGGSPTKYSVSGLVLDSDGAGIPGVMVAFVFRGGNSLFGPTTADGAWRRDGLTGSVTITPSKEGWVFEPESKVVSGSRDAIIFRGTKVQHPLSIQVQGKGAVTLDPAPQPDGRYPHDAQVQLTAVPETGWVFSHWEGDLQGSANPAVLTIDSPQEILAVFSQTGPILSGTIAVKHNFPYSVLEGRSVPKAMPEPEEYGHASGRPGEMIIIFDPSVTLPEQLKELQRAGYLIKDRLTVLNAHLVEPGDLDTNRMLGTGELQGARYAGPNQPMFPSAMEIPNDLRYQEQWHYPLIRLPQAWAAATGSRSIRIAVIDSGVDMNHSDLEAQLDRTYAYNFVDNDRDLSDPRKHGTHVAGIIGATTNNYLGGAGVMWDVDLLPIKVFPETGPSSSWDIATAVLYASGLLDEEGKPFNPWPADIINLSLGGEYCPLVEDAITKAYSQGVIIVASTGNENGPIKYPAAHGEVIAVGAVGLGDSLPKRAEYSNFGPEIDLVAPGGADDHGVLSTVPGSTYGLQIGTSMAAPHVSGVIGLMLSAGIPREEVRDILERSSMDLGTTGFDPYHGHGLINAYWAIHAVDRIKVMVGTRVEDTVEAVTETWVEPKGGLFQVPLPPSGEYRLIAWVDVTNNNIIDPGDYYAESEPFAVSPDMEFDHWHLEVEEVE